MTAGQILSVNNLTKPFLAILSTIPALLPPPFMDLPVVSEWPWRLKESIPPDLASLGESDREDESLGWWFEGGSKGWCGRW